MMKTKLLDCTPILTVADLQKAKEFYSEVLQFDISFEWGTPLSYLGIHKDDVCLHLNAKPHSRQEPGSGNITILTNEVDDYFLQCKQNNAEIVVSPDDREYGMRDFTVKDPDGNLLTFGCELASEN